MTKDEALRIALEALTDALNKPMWNRVQMEAAITAIKAALEAKDVLVGLIESLKDAQPCCGQYETCWRACTPRGKFIGQRDAQRTWVGLTDMEIDQGLCRTNYAMQTSGAWRDGVEWASKQLQERNS